jgi:beta-alanine degradation protein BauB
VASHKEVDANPIGTELIKEDDRVRIWRIVLEPGQVAPWHTHHLDYTSVIIEGSEMERYNEDGSTDRYVALPGSIRRKHEGSLRHSLKNVGSTRYSNVIIEIKE